MIGKWSDLPEELLVIVGGKIKLIEDFVAFRGVCSGWRSAAPKSAFTGISQLPCVLHALKLVPLPNAVVHHLHHRPPPPPLLIPSTTSSYKARRFASKGWLIANNIHGETYLFHPFSHAQIKLPHLSTLRCSSSSDCDPDSCEYKKPDFITRHKDPESISAAVLSSSPADSSNCAVVIIYDTCCMGDELAFWRPGNDNFILLNNYGPVMCWESITCCNGNLYALDSKCKIVVWDMNIVSNGVPTVQLVMEPPSKYLVRSWSTFIVESDNEAFIVGRAGDRRYLNPDNLDLFFVYRVDVTENKLCEVKDLRNRAIFYGVRAHACFFMEASEIPGCMPNCIYVDETARDYHTSKRRRIKPGIYSFSKGQLARFKCKRRHH